MEKRNGISITVKVKGLENYAKCVLHFTNLKWSSTTKTVAEVKTIEDTDLIEIIGYENCKDMLRSVAVDYGEIISDNKINILEVEDEDIEEHNSQEYNEVMDEYYSDDYTEFFVVGVFNS